MIKAHNFSTWKPRVLLCSPWWPESVRLRPPAEQQRSPPDPLWQRCGGECSRLWWQHQGGPYVAAEAGQYRFSLNEMQCGGEFGPPVVLGHQHFSKGGGKKRQSFKVAL